jgi:hypothetical protein
MLSQISIYKECVGGSYHEIWLAEFGVMRNVIYKLRIEYSISGWLGNSAGDYKSIHRPMTSLSD